MKSLIGAVIRIFNLGALLFAICALLLLMVVIFDIACGEIGLALEFAKGMVRDSYIAAMLWFISLEMTPGEEGGNRGFQKIAFIGVVVSTCFAILLLVSNIKADADEWLFPIVLIVDMMLATLLYRRGHGAKIDTGFLNIEEQENKDGNE